MENFFDKFKNEIIAGAESGFSNEVKDESATLTNPYEDMEDDTKEIENLQETATALYSDKIKEIAEGEIVAGGEAAVQRAAYRAKTMVKGGMTSAVNAFNKLAGRTSNIDKIMTKVSNKAKAAKKGLEKSGVPKDSEAKIEYSKSIDSYLDAAFKGINSYVEGFGSSLDSVTASTLTGVQIPMIIADKAKSTTGVKPVRKSATELKDFLEDYSASEVMEAAKDKYDEAMDDTEEVTLSVHKANIMKSLTLIETKAKTVKTDKTSNSIRKAASKLASMATKEGSDTDKSTRLEVAQQISTAISGQISVLTRIVKFAELACDKVVTAARALESRLPADK